MRNANGCNTFFYSGYFSTANLINILCSVASLVMLTDYEREALMTGSRALTEKIIAAAMEVHSYWGPGLLESIYEKSLAHELSLRGVEVQHQVRLDLRYKDLELDDEFVLDLVVEGEVIVELKVVKELSPIHEAQLMTYMKLTGCRVGLLINFNVTRLKDGLRRMSLPD
jgi:GxxExxY protein